MSSYYDRLLWKLYLYITLREAGVRHGISMLLEFWSLDCLTRGERWLPFAVFVHWENAPASIEFLMGSKKRNARQCLSLTGVIKTPEVRHK
jgi:hypothetical protein